MTPTKPPSRDAIIDAIIRRVEPTICPTFSMVGGKQHQQIEGRISLVDFQQLIRMARARGTEQ